MKFKASCSLLILLNSNLSGEVLYNGSLVYTVSVTNISSYRKFDIVIKNSEYIHKKTITIYPDTVAVTRIAESIIYRAYKDTVQIVTSNIKIDKENNQITVIKDGTIINITLSSKTITYGGDNVEGFGIVEVVGYK